MGSTSQQDMNQQTPTPIMQDPAPQSNYSPHPGMMGQQNLGQMDMANIDPNIGISQLSELASMSSVVPPSQQQQQTQQQQLSASAGGYDDLKHEAL